jgi:hypothetical protein
MDLFSMDKCGAIYTKHDLPGAVAQSGTSATSISNRPPSAGYFSSARFDQIANRLMAGMPRAVTQRQLDISVIRPEAIFQTNRVSALFRKRLH